MTDTHNLPLVSDAEGTTGGCCGGSSCGTAASTTQETSNTEQSTQTFQVSGLTCGHCASTVTSELKELPGVTEVRVDLVAGGISTVTIASTTLVDDAQVAAGLDEAGDYVLASQPN